jgi:hypothetical protein
MGNLSLEHWRDANAERERIPVESIRRLFEEVKT